MMNTNNIDNQTIKALDSYLSRGLCSGKGDPTKQVCVEAAICLAMGEPFSDRPTCVAGVVRDYSVELNDSGRWLSPSSRAAGMRELAIAQLGSNGVVDDVEFAKRLADKTIRVLLPKLFRALPGATAEMLSAADRCEKEGTRGAADAAASAARVAAEYDRVSGALYAADHVVGAVHAAHDAFYAARAGGAAEAFATTAVFAAYDAAACIGCWSEEYIRLSAALAVEVLRELKSPGVQFLPTSEGV